VRCRRRNCGHSSSELAWERYSEALGLYTLIGRLDVEVNGLDKCQDQPGASFAVGSRGLEFFCRIVKLGEDRAAGLALIL